MKKPLTLLLVIFLTVQFVNLSVLIVDSQGNKPRFTSNLALDENLSTKNLVLDRANEPIPLSNNVYREVIIFAENEESFDSLIDLPYSKRYDTLLAIKIRINQAELNNLNKYFPNIFPSQLYLKVQTPQYQSVEINSNLELNGVDDFNILGVNRLWDEGYIGENVVVGVIDNGVNFNHPDLESREFASKNFTIPGAEINYFHGTGVAGAIASTGESTLNYTGRGPAYGAKIAAANMGQSVEGFLVGDFLAAFDWLANFTEVKIINTSWSGGGEDIWIPVAKRLEQLGIMVIGAAGNEGAGKLNTLGSPANTVHGLSIGAINGLNNIASYSSEGPVGGGFTKPDVSAPGSSIYTSNTMGGYSYFTGTSFSAPLVSGAVAALISAITNNSIPYNVGLLKAAVMKTANNNAELEELRVGQGVVNVSKAYDLILDRAIATNEIPIMSLATPTTGFFDQLTNLRQNVYTEIPFTLISSNPKNVSITLSSILSDNIVIRPTNQSLNSQIIWLEIDTNGLEMGVHSANITIHDYFEILEIPLILNISSPPSFKVLFDLRHTTADLGYTVYRAGYETGTFIELVNQKGGWVDMSDAPLTSDLLSNYDLVWFPDVVPIDSRENTNITDSELTALQDYSENGGNIFIHYFGSFNDSLAQPGESSIVGTDLGQLNFLMSHYDMTASQNNPDLYEFFQSESNVHQEGVDNQTRLGKGIEGGITSFDSTSIIPFDSSIQSPTISITKNNMIVKWSKSGSGRVLVTSSSSWFSSHNAINNDESNDYKFMENVIDWFTADIRLEDANRKFKDDQMTVDLFVSKNFQPINIEPQIKFESNQTLFTNYKLENLDIGHYQLKFNIVNNGIHNVSIDVENEYLNYVFNYTEEIKPNENGFFEDINNVIGISLIIGIVTVFFVYRKYSFQQK